MPSISLKQKKKSRKGCKAHFLTTVVLKIHLVRALVAYVLAMKDKLGKQFGSS